MSNDELQKAIDDITNDASLKGEAEDEGTTVELPAEMSGEAALTMPEVGTMPPETPEVSKAEEDELAKQLEELQNAPAPEAAGAATPDLSNNPFVGNVIAEQEPVDTTGMMSAVKPLENEPVSSPEALEGLPKAEVVSEPGMDVLGPVEAPVASESTSEMPSMDANANLNAMVSAMGTDDAAPEASAPVVNTAPNADADLEQIKNDALTELYPLLANMKVNPNQKFDICMKVYDKTGDKGALGGALAAAKEMDVDAKGEALMKIIEKIG